MMTVRRTSDPQKPSDQEKLLSALPGAAKWRLVHARLILFWEELWPRLFLPTVILGLFLIVAGFDILPGLGPWGHGAVLALTLGALVISLWNLRRIKFPSKMQAVRRLEARNGLTHRPLTLTVDPLAIGRADPLSAKLWLAYKAQQVKRWRNLRVGWARASWARRDPYGVRQAVGLILILTVVGTGSEFGRGLERAVAPEWLGGTPETPPTIEAWISPPDYTALPPVYLQVQTEPVPDAADTSSEAAPITVPVGSKILAQVTGATRTSVLEIGDDDTELAEFAPGSYRGEVLLTEPGDMTLSIRTGRHRWQSWPIAVTADSAPQIAFSKQPAPTPRAALQLDYKATDDYGVNAIRVIVRRADGMTGPGSVAAVVLPLPAGGANPRQIQATSFADLAKHPWAGIEAEIFLEAYDQAGQLGRSDIVTVTLPERQFTHPVSQELIAQRKKLTLTPGATAEVAEVLQDLGTAPEAFDHDLGVTLSLDIMARMMASAPSDPEILKAQGMMWELAVSLEDGGLSLAMQELRDLQKQLQDAIARGASEEEIQQLTEQLRQAMDRYMEELARQAQQQLQRGGQTRPIDPASGELTRQELQDLLNQARDAALGGQRDQAQDLLNQLQNMLENMQVGIQPNQNQTGGNEAGQVLRELNNITRRQQRLLDQSLRDQQSAQPDGEGPQGGQQPGGQQSGGQQSGSGQGSQGQIGQGVDEQRALHRDLGEIIQRLNDLTGGQAPGNLGEAQQFMQQAIDALEQGDGAGAADPQGQAIDALRGGLQQLLQALQQGQEQGFTRGTTGPGGETRDPLGRLPAGRGPVDSGNVAIPDKLELQKAREILQELRRREADRTRPPLERDYIERLLRQF